MDDFIDQSKCVNCEYLKDNICLLKKQEIKDIYTPIGCANFKLKELEDKPLKEVYNEIVEILKYYCDLKEDYYHVVSTWIIGTYFHKNFLTYPYLFFNAPKGSGKTRLLKLISTLSNNGELIVSMSEAVLFRIAGKSTLCIDEFENMNSKDKQALREVLNAGYKKGLSVKRATKLKTAKEQYVIETFDVFSPKAMANIWGMNEVLSDRSITMILDKSNNPIITKMVENYDTNPNILKTKEKLMNLVNLVLLVSSGGYIKTYTKWNEHVKNTNYTTTLTTQTTEITETTSDNDELFEKIRSSDLNGRNLELFLPLFLISKEISDYLTDLLINFALEIERKNKEDDLTGNRDILLLDFICDLKDTEDFIRVNEITHQLKELEENENINNWWVGRALKRLNLVKEKRRMGSGVEIRIDFKKAREKLRIFKPEKVNLNIKEESLDDR